MTKTQMTPYALRVADLAQRRATPFDIVPNGAELKAIGAALDLIDLKKLRFRGEIRPLGATDWEMIGQLGATVVQHCVATLDPVTSRIDTEVARRFLAHYETPDDPEAEMPEDDETEALGAHIDPGLVLSEALSLALPVYPRSDAADPIALQVTEPGKTAMSDDDAKPFAGLAKLRDALGNSDDD